MSKKRTLNKNKKFIVGLTGGIACGKTTIANSFKQHNIDIVDADIVAREVVEPGMPALEEIIQYFGEDIVLDSGQLNRSLLRTIIFSDEQKKVWLNQLLHPLIRQSMLKQIETTTSQYCLLVAPLLIENNLHQLVNRILVIDIHEDIQIVRATQRDPSNEQEIKRIIASQIPRKQRLLKADDVINNESTDRLFIDKKVANLHLTYLEHSKNDNTDHQ